MIYNFNIHIMTDYFFSKELYHHCCCCFVIGVVRILIGLLSAINRGTEVKQRKKNHVPQDFGRIRTVKFH